MRTGVAAFVIRHGLALVFAVMSFGTAARAEIPCRYEVEILTLPSCGGLYVPWAIGSALNDQGVMVGYRERCYPNGQHTDAFMLIAGKVVTIPRPPGVPSARAAGINNVGGLNGAGMVVGSMRFTDNRDRAFLFDGTQTINLGIPPGMNNAGADAINDGGEIVGAVHNSITGPLTPCRWHNGAITLLRTPLNYNGSATDINSLGVIVGSFSEPHLPPNSHAFRYRDGAMEDLGFPSGADEASAGAINDRGQIAMNAGYDETVPPYIYSRGFIWTDGALTEVGILPGYDACGVRDLNDLGQAVGSCVNIAVYGTPDAPFLWDNGIQVRLEELIRHDPPLRVLEAKAINNAGQIAAIVDSDIIGIGGAAILTPVPQSPSDLTKDCVTDHEDLTFLLGDWGLAGTPADLNGDGIVNVLDLLLLLASWG
jgi:probable HAF family extracellular repeat protein